MSPTLPRSQRTRSYPCIRIAGMAGCAVKRKPCHHDQRERNGDLIGSRPREVAKGTLRSLIRAAGITVSEFIART